MALNFPSNPAPNDTHEPGNGATYIWNDVKKVWEWDHLDLGGAKAPVAKANGPYTANIAQAITFSSGGSYDRDSYIAAYDWDFGDGDPHSSDPNPSHAYAATGSYTATLVVTDNTGLTSTDTAGVTISESGAIPPVAVVVGPIFDEPSVSIAFDASGSYDLDGTIVKYDWDWGDTNQSLDAGATPSHTYASDGDYTVTVTVTDDAALTNQATTTAFIATAVANPIPAENDLTAYPAANWDIRTAVTSGENLGYPKPESVNAGGTIEFFVDGASTSIDIVRVGSYDEVGGNHGRLVQTIANTPTNQPGETTIVGQLSENSFGGTDCTGWTASATWNVPVDAVSGLYLAIVKGTPDQQIEFVVREDSRAADIVIIIPTNTHLAYNAYGGPATDWNLGKSLYHYGVAGTGAGLGWSAGRGTRAYAVSRHKPNPNRENYVNNHTRYDMAAAQWFEKQGYNVKYITDEDLDGGLSWLGGSKMLVMPGHNEYWTQNMRDNLVAMRELGVHLVVLAANVHYWLIVKDPVNPHIVWCKKRTHEGAAGDAYDPDVSSTTGDPAWLGWTGTYYDLRSELLDPNGYTPQLPQEIVNQFFKMDAAGFQDIVVNGPTYQSLPIWRDTPVAGGTDLTLTGFLGFEGDEMRDPADGRAYVWLADTDVLLSGSCYDENGHDVGTCTPTFGLTLSRTDPAHGCVFATGSMNSVWALTDYHTGTGTPVNTDWQQALVNVLADFGATADTLDPALTTPTPVALSTYGLDWNPVAVISGPTQVSSGAAAAFDGTGSSDPNGTIVSYFWSFGDGSTSTSATPSYIYAADGIYTVTLTVTDNDGLTGQATHNITVGQPEVNVFGALTPGTLNAGDATDIVIGVRVVSSVDGNVNGIRFYANTAMAPSEVALYQQIDGSSGTLLGSANVVDAITPNAWNQVNFASPIAVTTGTVYVACMSLPGGQYAFDAGFLADADYVNGSLTAPQTDTINAGNGCYQYSTAVMQYPTQWSLNPPNAGGIYWVDLAFQGLGAGNQPPVAVAGGPYSGEPDVAVSFDGSGSYDPDGSIVQYDWDFGDATSGVGATPTHTYTAAGSYTASLTVTDNEGATHVDSVGVSIAIAQAEINIFGTLAPSTLNADFTARYAMGTRFNVAMDGNITGVRVYTSETNMVSEVALYSVEVPSVKDAGVGVQLATKAVVSTSAGWNEILFDTPVPVTPGVEYIAQKLMAGNFTDWTSGGFFNATSYTNADLPTGRITAPETNVTNDGNARYKASAVMALADSWSAVATNSQWYGVDAIFEPVGTPTADAGGPYTGTVDSPVSFSAAASADPFGAIIRYDWDFGDGNTLNDGGPTPSHTYTSEVGSPFTVGVTVTDSEGLTDAASTTATISVGAVPDVQPFFSGDLTWGSQSTDAIGYVQGSFFTPTASGQVTEVHMYESADMAAGSLDVQLYTVTPAPPYADPAEVAVTPIGTAEAMTLTGTVGWRTLTLATPISVTASTTYVVGCAPQAYLPNNAYVQEIASVPVVAGYGTIYGAVGHSGRTGDIDRARDSRYYPFDITFLAS